MTTFEFEKHIKVTTLDIKWDLYKTTADVDGKITFPSYVQKALTKAAIEAIEKRDQHIWFEAADKYWEFGAYDTEPRVQFADLWSEAYGEDIY